MAVVGQAHQPEFTMECRVGGSSCTAKGTTKQSAKRFAAEAMLEQFKDVNVNNNNEAVKPLPILDLPTIEEIIAEYRRLKTPHIKRQKSLLRIRPNFFLKLPVADRNRARTILLGQSDISRSDKETVHKACEELKIQYKIEKIVLLNGIHSIFSLIECDYDCVIVGTTDTLFAKVIDYLKTMLDIERPFSGMVNVF